MNDISAPNKQPPPIPVLILISNLGHGGAERQAVEIFNHINRSMFDLHLCTLSKHVPNASQLKSVPGRFHQIEKRYKYDATTVLRLYKLLKTYQIQIVHSFLFDADIVARLGGKLARCPLVISSERNSNHNYRAIQTLLYKATRRLVDLCIANSQAGADYHEKAFGLPKSKFRLLRNGVDLNRFKPSPNQTARETLGLKENTLVVGMFASFKRQKNHLLLIESIPKIIETHQNVIFLFLGGKLAEGKEGGSSGQSYEQEILNAIDRLKINNYCQFLGPKEDIEHWYALCDLTVLPSLYEGTPNVLLESLACGTPVIATDVSDNRDILPERCGAIIPPNDPKALADSVSEFLADSEKRQTMSYQARKYAEKEFSLPHMAKTLENIYLEASRAH